MSKPREEKDFVALKGTHATQGHIQWQQVFQLRAATFAKHPHTLATIQQSLSFIESTPQGQQLFRDLLTHPARTSRIRLATPERAHPIPEAAFVADEDTIRINPKDFENPAMHRFQAIVSRTRTPLEYMITVLAHESDHAASVPTAMLYNPSPSRAIDRQFEREQACIESKGVARENQFRQLLGIPLRTHYADSLAQLRYLDREIELAKSGVIRPSQSAARAVMSDLLQASPREIAAQELELNKGCTTGPGGSAAEIKALTETLHTQIQELHTKHGIPRTQDPSNPATWPHPGKSPTRQGR